MVAISVDTPVKSAALAQKLSLTLPLLSDPSLGGIRAYGVEDADNGIAWPTLFIVAPDGTVRWHAPAESVGKRPDAATVLDELTRAGL